MATQRRISFQRTVPHVPRVGAGNRIDLEGGDGMFLRAAGEEIAYFAIASETVVCPDRV